MNTYDPALQRLRQEDQEFHASLGFIGRPYLKTSRFLLIIMGGIGARECRCFKKPQRRASITLELEFLAVVINPM